MAKKPTAAFALLLIGGVFVLLQGILAIALGSLLSFMPSIMGASSLSILVGVFIVMLGIIIMTSGILMNAKDKEMIKAWSIIGLVFSLVSLFFGGGFFIGFLLGFIGSILGLTFKA